MGSKRALVFLLVVFFAVFQYSCGSTGQSEESLFTEDGQLLLTDNESAEDAQADTDDDADIEKAIAGTVTDLAGTPGQLENIGIYHSNNTRSGVYYLPKGFDPSKEYPLVVLLHGLGGNGAGMANEFMSLADSKGLILLAPDGFLRKNPFGSNNIYYFNPNFKRNAVADYNFIIQCVQAMMASFPIDTTHVLVAGMSMGAPASLFVGTKASYFTHGALMHGVRWNYDQGAKNDVMNILWFPWEQTPINSRRPLFWYSTSVDDWVTNYSSIPFTLSVNSDLTYLKNAGLKVTNKFCYTGGHTMGSLEKQEMINWFLNGTGPGACK